MDSAIPPPSDARALAAQLASWTDDALQALLTARAISTGSSWHDFFDAAEALLEPSSIDRALTRMSRSALVDLAHRTREDAAAHGGETLGHLGVLREDGTVYGAVADRVNAMLVDRPDAFTPIDTPAATTTASDLESAAAAERAALSISALADVLLLALAAPLVRTGSGSLAATDRRRLIDTGVVASPEELDELLESASTADLAVRADREWLVTSAGEQWLRLSTADRWSAVVEGFRSALPSAVRTPLSGIVAPAGWHDEYPLDSDWPGRCALLTRIAARWGLISDTGAEPAWASSLRVGGEADATGLSALLPPEIHRIYLQADLSAIAPGPLAPALDLRLRTMAARESRAQASTYRFTAESIGAAVSAGETAASLRAFLTELSLTGIPQPLEYLIDRTSSRHGLVRVRADAANGRTRVDSDDPSLLAALAVDQSVRPIGLVRDGDALTSRVARDAVYWTLVDARYPVVALDGDGEPEPLHRRRLGSTPSSADAGPAHRRLIDTLRAAHATDADVAWLGRELDTAVRARATVIVAAALPDGSTREFTLEVTGLGGGRLRGRDRGSDTERTLPVSSIVSVRPA